MSEFFQGYLTGLAILDESEARVVQLASRLNETEFATSLFGGNSWERGARIAEATATLVTRYEAVFGCY